LKYSNRTVNCPTIIQVTLERNLASLVEQIQLESFVWLVCVWHKIPGLSLRFHNHFWLWRLGENMSIQFDHVPNDDKWFNWNELTPAIMTLHSILLWIRFHLSFRRSHSVSLSSWDVILRLFGSALALDRSRDMPIVRLSLTSIGHG